MQPRVTRQENPNSEAYDLGEYEGHRYALVATYGLTPNAGGRDRLSVDYEVRRDTALPYSDQAPIPTKAAVKAYNIYREIATQLDNRGIKPQTKETTGWDPRFVAATIHETDVGIPVHTAYSGKDIPVDYVKAALSAAQKPKDHLQGLIVNAQAL